MASAAPEAGISRHATVVFNLQVADARVYSATPLAFVCHNQSVSSGRTIDEHAYLAKHLKTLSFLLLHRQNYDLRVFHGNLREGGEGQWTEGALAAAFLARHYFGFPTPTIERAAFRGKQGDWEPYVDQSTQVYALPDHLLQQVVSSQKWRDIQAFDWLLGIHDREANALIDATRLPGIDLRLIPTFPFGGYRGTGDLEIVAYEFEVADALQAELEHLGENAPDLADAVVLIDNRVALSDVAITGRGRSPIAPKNLPPTISESTAHAFEAVSRDRLYVRHAFRSFGISDNRTDWMFGRLDDLLDRINAGEIKKVSDPINVSNTSRPVQVAQ